MQSGLVSIMMPAYNAEKYIGKAIESVLAQSYPHWELIVVNDGSVDGTTEVVSLYTNDARIKLIHQANGGEAAARNTALEHAQGEYLSFLDADDLYLPNSLADLSTFLNQHSEYDVVFSDGYFCDEYEKKLMQLSEIRPRLCTGKILEPLILSSALITVPVCVMVRRNAIERLSIKFDTNLVIGPDWDFWIQLAAHVQFGYLDRVTCMYRVHYTNITRTSGVQKRNRDLVQGRIKVLNSDWFEDLSTYTRRKFFYDLLINLLANQPSEQEAILNSKQFQNLPSYDQARIWRQVGIDYLLKDSKNQEFVLDCLHRAASLYPADQKTRILLQALNLGKLPTLGVLYLWRGLYKVYMSLHAVGRRKAKPVPVQLRSVGD